MRFFSPAPRAWRWREYVMYCAYLSTTYILFIVGVCIVLFLFWTESHQVHICFCHCPYHKTSACIVPGLENVTRSSWFCPLTILFVGVFIVVYLFWTEMWSAVSFVPAVNAPNERMYHTLLGPKIYQMYHFIGHYRYALHALAPVWYRYLFRPNSDQIYLMLSVVQIG